MLSPDVPLLPLLPLLPLRRGVSGVINVGTDDVVDSAHSVCLRTQRVHWMHLTAHCRVQRGWWAVNEAVADRLAWHSAPRFVPSTESAALRVWSGVETV